MQPLALAGRHLVVVKLSRRNVPVEWRERLVLDESVWAAWIAHTLPDISEWSLVRTCHRFELYLVSASPEADAAHLTDRLRELVVPPEHAQPAIAPDASVFPAADRVFTVCHGVEAAEHLCRVAAGLDSAVLGEPQILGQVIRSYEAGITNGTLGPLLAGAYRAAIRVGKRARAETTIAARAVNMSSLALARAAAWLGGLEQAHVVVIGAGKMARLALKALASRKVGQVTVVNRTLDNARAALAELGRPNYAVNMRPLCELAQTLEGADLIFSATHADGYMVRAHHVQTMLAQSGRDKRLALVDLAVPRDIDPQVRGLANVLLIDVDDLQEALDETRKERAAAIPQVEQIIREELLALQAELREWALHPVVADLRRKAEEIRAQEVERALQHLGAVDETTKEQIHRLSRSLVNKLLHPPTVGIKALAHSHDAGYLADTVRALFALGPGDGAQGTRRPSGAGSGLSSPGAA